MRHPIPFGTDGIRGPFGIAPLDQESLIHIAETISIFIDKGTLAIARDTRSSGVEIADILTKTLTEHGIHVIDCGILPTAALACVVAEEQLDLGIVITASHNPSSDNGIKLFGPSGNKLSKSEQDRFQSCFTKFPTPSKGKASKHTDPSQAWRSRLPQPDLTGMRILLDCAHGSLSPFAESILTQCGAKVTSIGSAPNGENINNQVGALHPPTTSGTHDIALCFDGDADRLIVCTKQGILDGDDILFLMRDAVEGPLVGTVMSNGGLDAVLQGRLLRSQVGDQHVFALMKEHNALLGAEPSGHIIFQDDNMPSGDGLYAALRLLDHCALPLVNDWTRWPTHQQSIRFTESQLPFGKRPSLKGWTSIKEAEQTGHRLVVRYSGTEPKLRILVEGEQAEYYSQQIQEEFLAKLL